MKKFLKKFFWLLEENLGLGNIRRELKFDAELSRDDYLRKYLYDNEKYANAKKLNKFEYNVYSQGGEDGLLAEIFKRTGTTNKFFVEFGIGNGLQNNTLFLLLNGWQGCWIDGAEKAVKSIKETHKFVIGKKLEVKNSFITAENIESLFALLAIPKEPDFLSIDIDGNDYWVWRAISKYQPRVVVIEYNGLFPPDLKWVMKYNPQNKWNRTSYYGASLKSLELLGREKGYKLVGCNFAGENAFFVREDLVGDKFHEPFTAENHYETKKLFLLRESGDRRSFGEFENI